MLRLQHVPLETQPFAAFQLADKVSCRIRRSLAPLRTFLELGQKDREKFNRVQKRATGPRESLAS